jgi:hypothetical protein
MGMQLMAMRPPRDESALSVRKGEGEINGYVPHSFSGASQVTVVEPLNEEFRLKIKSDVRMRCLPVVSADGDGRAAQANGHIDASEVEADESCNGGSRAAGRRDDAGTALGGGRGSDRGRGSAVGHGGSKGLNEGRSQLGEKMWMRRSVQ